MNLPKVILKDGTEYPILEETFDQHPVTVNMRVGTPGNLKTVPKCGTHYFGFTLAITNQSLSPLLEDTIDEMRVQLCDREFHFIAVKLEDWDTKATLEYCGTLADN